MLDLRVPLALIEGLPFKKIKKLVTSLGQDYNPDETGFKLCTVVSWTSIMRSLGSVRSYLNVALSKSEEIYCFEMDETSLHIDFTSEKFSSLDIIIKNESLDYIGFDITDICSSDKRNVDKLIDLLDYTVKLIEGVLPYFCYEWGLNDSVCDLFNVLLDINTPTEELEGLAYNYFFTRGVKPCGMAMGNIIYAKNRNAAIDFFRSFENDKLSDFNKVLLKLVETGVIFVRDVDSLKAVLNSERVDFMYNLKVEGLGLLPSCGNLVVNNEVSSSLSCEVNQSYESIKDEQTSFIDGLGKYPTCILIDCENMTSKEVWISLFKFCKLKKNKYVLDARVVFVYDDSEINQDWVKMIKAFESFVTVTQGVEIIPVMFMKSNKIYSLTDMALATYAGIFCKSHTQVNFVFLSCDSDIAGIIQTLNTCDNINSVGVMYNNKRISKCYRMWCLQNGVCCFDITSIEPECESAVSSFTDHLRKWLYENEYKQYIEDRVSTLMSKGRHAVIDERQESMCVEV